jgi:hypothetical protein
VSTYTHKPAHTYGGRKAIPKGDMRDMRVWPIVTPKGDTVRRYEHGWDTAASDNSADCDCVVVLTDRTLCYAVFFCVLQGMEDWSQEELERVVREKHGAEKVSNETKIICKFFLDAVEKKQYGWFWKCPNGGDCKYRCVSVDRRRSSQGRCTTWSSCWYMEHIVPCRHLLPSPHLHRHVLLPNHCGQSQI